MTFLNPLALFGLLAAALPILLHLLNLRKLRTIDFSTLAFLKELQKTRIRRLKLRQLLLLVLRTLLILLIVLAFARPTLQGSLVGNIGSHARTSAVFIIDDSYSMTVSNEHGELLKQAREAAGRITHLFSDGDEVFLVRLSALPKEGNQTIDAVRDFALLRKSIDDIGPTAIRRSLEQGIRVASGLLASSRNFNREIFIFSDFQRGVLSDESREHLPKEKLFPPEAQFFLISSASGGIQNFGLESITIPTSIFERDKPFVIQTRVGNFSESDVQDHVVSLFLNGTRVAERTVDIRKNASVPVEFSAAAGAVGSVEGFVELEDDDFQYDNRRYFVVQIPDRIRVLLVGDAHDVQYPQLALTTRTSANESALVLTVVAPDRLNATIVRRSDVIVLCTTEGLTSAQLSDIHSFASNGGGVAIFPGPQLNSSTFNLQISRKLGVPQCSGIDRPSSPPGETGSYVEFDKVELRHPIFEGMFESPSSQQPKTTTSPASTGKRVESPRIRTSARYNLSVHSNSIITLTNGAPFLIEQSSERGRILLFSVPPTIDWSDFPLKGLFVPLMHRATLYLAHQQTRSGEVLPGDEITVRSSSAPADTWTIRNPQKLETAATPMRQSFQRVLRFAATDQIGFYEVSARGTPLQTFAVNLDPQESQTGRSETAEMDKLLQRIGIENNVVHRVDQTTDLERRVLESRFGVELWKYLLMLALAVAVTEMFVARSTKREIGANP